MTKEKWVELMANQAVDEQINDRILYGRYDNRVTVVDLRTGKTAQSFCSPEDDFDFETGIAIAYARLREIKIHNAFIEKKVFVADVPAGTRFTKFQSIYEMCGRIVIDNKQLFVAKPVVSTYGFSNPSPLLGIFKGKEKVEVL